MNIFLSNAIKFSDNNSKICISVSYETKMKHGITFAVRDQGPGISIKNKFSLFQPFTHVRPGELHKGKLYMRIYMLI